MSERRFEALIMTLDALIRERDGWADLARESLEPNPFYEPDFLTAQTHLRPKREIHCLVVRDKIDDSRLCGVFPLEKPHLRDGLPFGALALYRNPYTCLTTPLIRYGDADAILKAALDQLARNSKRLLIPMIPENRPFACLLRAHAKTRGLDIHRVDGRVRAAVETALNMGDYRTRLWKKNTRSAERSRLKRLEALGSVQYRRIGSAEPEASQVLEAFLALEARGWKGKRDTALASHPDTLAFAKAALLPEPGFGETIYEMLQLDGKPIAISVNLVAGGVGYALKSTYDEEFATLGVGTLLDGMSISLATGGGPLSRLDSCAAMDHPIRHRWRQEERVGRYLLGLVPGTQTSAISRWLGLIGPFGVWRGYGLNEA
ncbi:MAG: hypothetical protein FD175_874 [Beijerinckiaceae bacterium]|nr:MAG: hypothetical protein FD175_874 [Beijerinckiaceae bacterium]